MLWKTQEANGFDFSVKEEVKTSCGEEVGRGVWGEGREWVFGGGEGNP